MELFEVSRNEYASFIRCLKKGAVRYKEETEGYVKINQVISNSRDIVLCARVENKDEDIGEKYYIFEKQKPVPENLGTFLLAFLNTNFNTKEDCKDFIFEYLYVNLLVRINRNIHLDNKFRSH